MIDWYEYIHESNLIEGIDDAHEDGNSLQAWGWLTRQREIDFSKLSTLHRMIVKDNHWMETHQKGYLRVVDVTVGGERCPDYRELPKLVAAWLHTFFTLDPIDAHVAFEQIHPFVDGNGRTGRMLYWWQCLQENLTPEFFNSQNRGSYYSLFRQKILMEAWIDFIQTQR